MFFVVYLLNKKQHVVIPTSWVQNIDEHWEKFVNRSLNRNQTFRVFYNQNALDDQGKPDVDFKPDFNLGTNVEFPASGCYLAKLIIYKGEYFVI